MTVNVIDLTSRREEASIIVLAVVRVLVNRPSSTSEATATSVAVDAIKERFGYEAEVLGWDEADFSEASVHARFDRMPNEILRGKGTRREKEDEAP